MIYPREDGRETKGRWMIDDERRTKGINSVRELEVYKLAFDTAMEIFEMTKKFPKVIGQ